MNASVPRVLFSFWFLFCAEAVSEEEEKETEGGTVTPLFPEDGATSFRVLQDLHWPRHGSLAQYDLRIDRFNPATGNFELFYVLEGIPETGKLTNSGDFDVCRFDPAVFLADLSSVPTPEGVVERAPVFFPGSQYRWGVRFAGASAWVFRDLNIEYDPLSQIGMDTHLGFSSDWFDLLFELVEISASAPNQVQREALAADVVQLRPPYIFEGASLTWGRDYFRAPMDQFSEFRTALNEWDDPITPQVIAHTIFQPFRIRQDAMGQPVRPVLGEDYFTMFDFTDMGPDQSRFNKTTFVPTAPFGGHDPYTRPLYLYRTMLSGVEQTWHDLFAPFNQISNQFVTTQQDPTGANLMDLETLKMDYHTAAMGYVFDDPPDPNAPGAPPTAEIRDQFSSYVEAAVTEFKDRIELWHFHNEASGGWYVDPHLYARQLAFFAETVWGVDPQERVMVASMVQPSARACTDQSLVSESPHLFWFEEFVERTRTLIDQGVISQLPFQVLGLNGGFIKFESSDPAPCFPGASLAAPDPCEDMIAQDCRFEKFLEYYRGFREILDQLESDFGAELSIIYKETATSHPDLNVAAQEAPRGIAFLHELGHLKTNSPALFSGLPSEKAESEGESSTPVPERLFNAPNASEVEAVLWFHYHLDLSDLSRHVNVIEPTMFPSINHTPFEAALRDVNHASCDEPLVANAGPDQWTFCNGPVGIGTGAPHYYTYLWSPQDGLSDPFSPTPEASPTVTTTYTLTVTNLCGDQETDQVVVRVLPVITDLGIQDPGTILIGDPLEVQLTIGCGQNLAEPIRLRLHNAMNPGSTFIATVPPQTTSFTWCSPASVLPANRYFIEATTIDGDAIHLAKSSEFDIAPTNVTLDEPSGGFYGPSGSLSVSWTWQGGAGLVSLAVVRVSDGVVVANLTDPASPISGASGSFSGQYSGLTDGENHVVRMELVDCPVGLSWFSSSFSIASIELQMADPWCGEPSFYWNSSLPAGSPLRLRIVSDDGVTDNTYLVFNFGALVLARVNYPTNTNYILTIESVDHPTVRDEVILVPDC